MAFACEPKSQQQLKIPIEAEAELLAEAIKQQHRHFCVPARRPMPKTFTEVRESPTTILQNHDHKG